MLILRGKTFNAKKFSYAGKTLNFAIFAKATLADFIGIYLNYNGPES